MENLSKKIETSLSRLNELNISEVVDKNLSPWNGYTQEHLFNDINEISEIISKIIENDYIEGIPYNILNSLNQKLSTTVQKIQQLINQVSQNNFNNAISQTESLRGSLASWGLKNQALYGIDFQEKIQAIDSEYQSIISQKKEINDLIESVNNLIEPSVAGSLSSSFKKRQDKIKTNRIIWLVILIISAVLSIIMTINIIGNLLETFNFPKNATPEQISKIINKQPNNPTLQFLRIAILFPFYTLFVYSFSQYKKERNLEEEYAHRAAVAISLPNYGDLATDVTVKDQILSEASKVVFMSPTENYRKNYNKKENTESVLAQLNDIVKNLKQVN